MIRLWLVRHGESTANAGEKCQGPESSLLTQLGEDQANRAAIGLTKLAKPDLVVVSPFMRAQQTSQPFLKATGLQAEVWPIQEWSFLNPTKYAGTTQIERKPYVQEYAEMADPHHCDGGGAESFRGFVSRVDFFLEAARAYGGNIVAFSHGRFIQGVKWRVGFPSERFGWSSEEMRQFWKFSEENPVENCSITELEYSESRWRIL